jgi:hypothetical protein
MLSELVLRVRRLPLDEVRLAWVRPRQLSQEILRSAGLMSPFFSLSG